MAILEFREQVTDANGQTTWVPAKGTINGQEKVLSSAYFKDTYVTTDNSSNILLVFEWTAEGSQLSEQITSRLIGKPLAIFEGDEPLLGEDGQPIVPIIQSVIKDWGQIQGLSLHEATTLSKLLNASQ
jgi:preprotein translocase subunit SecD